MGGPSGAAPYRPPGSGSEWDRRTPPWHGPAIPPPCPGWRWRGQLRGSWPRRRPGPPAPGRRWGQGSPAGARFRSPARRGRGALVGPRWPPGGPVARPLSDRQLDTAACRSREQESRNGAADPRWLVPGRSPGPRPGGVRLRWAPRWSRSANCRWPGPTRSPRPRRDQPGRLRPPGRPASKEPARGLRRAPGRLREPPCGQRSGATGSGGATTSRRWTRRRVPGDARHRAVPGGSRRASPASLAPR